MKKNRMSEINIPDWLMSLPAGEYCITELCERFNLSYHQIYQRFYVLNLPTCRRDVSLGMGMNKRIIFYIWKGFIEESAKINNKRLGKLNEVKKGKKK